MVSSSEYPLTQTKITSGEGAPCAFAARKPSMSKAFTGTVQISPSLCSKRRPFFLHSGEMRTARDERYIRTVFCQKSTERSACPARADDHIAKSHILSSLKLFVQ